MCWLRVRVRKLTPLMLAQLKVAGRSARARCSCGCGSVITFPLGKRSCASRQTGTAPTAATTTSHTNIAAFAAIVTFREHNMRSQQCCVFTTCVYNMCSQRVFTTCVYNMCSQRCCGACFAALCSSFLPVAMAAAMAAMAVLVALALAAMMAAAAPIGPGVFSIRLASNPNL